MVMLQFGTTGDVWPWQDFWSKSSEYPS